MHGLKQLLTHIARNRRRKSESSKSRNAALSRMFLYSGSAIVATGLLSGTIALAESEPRPQAVAFAATTTQLMVTALFASAMSGLNATTTANADSGKQSVSLLFGRNPNTRQVGVDQPLNPANRPQDSFEKDALAAALTGQNYTSVEQINFQWYLRSSVPLNNFSTACVSCHPNFGAANPSQFVGALMVRVPIVTPNHEPAR